MSGDTDKFVFDYGLDVRRRTIFLNHTMVGDEEESIGYKAVDTILRGMHILEARTESPITIMMNSWGGDEYHGLAIYDRIDSSPCEIVIVGIGHVMSMGTWILQAADKRLLSRNASVMIHYGTWLDGYDGVHAKDALPLAKEGERLNKLMEDVFLEAIREAHPKTSRASLARKLERDTYMTADAAIELGLADGIWTG